MVTKVTELVSTRDPLPSDDKHVKIVNFNWFDQNSNEKFMIYF